MIYFTLQRLKIVWLQMSTLLLLAYLVHPYWESVGQFSIVAVFALMFREIPNNWIQILPYSRKKIMTWYAAEAVVVTISAIVFVSAIAVLLKIISLKQLFLGYDHFYLLWGILFFAMGTVRFCMPIVPDFKKNHSGESRKKNFMRLALFFSGIVLLNFLGNQPLFWIAVVIVLLTIFPVTSYSMLSPPINSVRRWRKVTAFLTVTVLAMTGIYISLEVRSMPITARTDTTMAILGDLHFPVSKQRALEVLESPQVGSSKFVLALEKQYGPEVSLAKMKEKTARCFGRDCFELVTVMSRRFDEEQKLELFSAVLERCLLERDKEGSVKCRRELHASDLAQWFSFFASSQALDHWLKSDKLHERFAAIWTLQATGANPAQIKSVQKIIDSYSDISSDEGKKLISIHQPRALLDKAKCGIDRKDLSCDRLKNFRVAELLSLD